jgi:hypothetical protein
MMIMFLSDLKPLIIMLKSQHNMNNLAQNKQQPKRQQLPPPQPNNNQHMHKNKPIKPLKPPIKLKGRPTKLKSRLIKLKGKQIKLNKMKKSPPNHRPIIMLGAKEKKWIPIPKNFAKKYNNNSNKLRETPIKLK